MIIDIGFRFGEKSKAGFLSFLASEVWPLLLNRSSLRWSFSSNAAAEILLMPVTASGDRPDKIII